MQKLKTSKTAIILAGFASLLTATCIGQDSIESSDILFRIGNIEVNKHIYLKERHKEQLRQDMGKSPYDPFQKNQMNRDWISGWIARLYVVNIAIDQGYGKDEDIAKEVEMMSRYMQTQSSDGPLSKHASNLSQDEIRPRESGSLIKLSRAKNAYIKSLNLLSDIQYQEESLKTILPIVRENKTDYIDLEETNIAGETNIILYTTKGEPRAMNLETFLSEYNFLLFKTSPKNGRELRELVRSIALDRELRKHVEHLKLHEDPIFLSEKENYKNSLIYRKYLENELYPSVVIEEAALSREYESLRSKLSVPSRYEAAILEFETPRSAGRTFAKIDSIGEATRRDIELMADEYGGNAKFEILDRGDFLISSEISQWLTEVSVFSPSWVIEKQGKYTIVAKTREFEYYYKSTEEAREELISHMRERKADGILRELVTSGSKKYNIWLSDTVADIIGEHWITTESSAN